MKKILFCTPTALTKALGAPKVVVELAEGLRELGWDCDVRGRYDLDAAPGQAALSDEAYIQHLRRFLLDHAGEYDVVDYDHYCLPFPRSDFALQTLFVARSVLLAHHFDVIPIPVGRSLKAGLKQMILGGCERAASRQRTQRAHSTVQEADLVNVCNEEDKAELVRCGIDREKIVVIPFGISRSRRPLFDAVSSAVPKEPVVAFVGTFDYRKGAREFPALVERIVNAVPNARFRLLGTAGMFQTKAAVLAHFPVTLRQKIEVIPRFAPEELPSLLASCSVGIFPSYIEGMPFGVLEMLAASVPVIAYDSPGPPMLLPTEYLTTRGDFPAMSSSVVALLTNLETLGTARTWARKQSRQFCWERIAQKTNDIYVEWSHKEK